MSHQQADHSVNPASTSEFCTDTELVVVGCTQEEDALRAYEETIKQCLVEGLFQAGAVLRKIRDEKLYLSACRTFDGYLCSRWGWSYSHVHRLIEAAGVLEVLRTSPNGEVVLPTAEAQVRPLVRLKDPQKQRAVWRRAVKLVDGKVPTADKVKIALTKLYPPQPRRCGMKCDAATPTPESMEAEEVPATDIEPNPTIQDEPPSVLEDNADATETGLVQPPVHVATSDEDESLSFNDPGHSQDDETPAQKARTCFVLVDASEVASEFIAEGDPLTPQDVRQAFDLAKRKSPTSTPAGMATQQKAVILLAEYVNQTLKVNQGLNPIKALAPLMSAYVAWNELLKKKECRK